MPYAYNGAITDSVYTGGTWNGNRIWEVLHTAGTSGYGGYESWRQCVDQPVAGTGTYSTTRRVAIKICILEGSITDMALHSGGGNGSHNGADWTAIPEYEVPADCPVKSGWYQFLADGSWNSNSVGHCVGLGFISYNRVKILTTEPMYYPSNHLIPFTGYQRSATQGLKDLTGRSTIDLSNVSFDSNADIEFDGSNDNFKVNVDSVIRTYTAVTFESLHRDMTGTGGATPYSLLTSPNSDGNADGFWHHWVLGGQWYWRLEDNVNGEVGGIFSGDTPFQTGKWYHVVAVVKTNTILYYLNGALVQTVNTSFAWANLRSDHTAYLYLGSGYGDNYYFGGNLPVFKMYSRELTASEIQQNFNAVRGRYGI